MSIDTIKENWRTPVAFFNPYKKEKNDILEEYDYG